MDLIFDVYSLNVFFSQLTNHSSCLFFFFLRYEPESGFHLALLSDQKMRTVKLWYLLIQNDVSETNSPYHLSIVSMFQHNCKHSHNLACSNPLNRPPPHVCDSCGRCANCITWPWHCHFIRDLSYFTTVNIHFFICKIESNTYLRVLLWRL